jgi:hypothetical protein
MAGANSPIGSSLGQILAPQSSLSPRSEAAKAAQKAFFQAALNPQAAATAAGQAAAAQTVAAVPAATPTQAGLARPNARTSSSGSGSGGMANWDPDNPPERILRPGSFVNIVV